ncbi:MAG: glycosyltransferase family 2 protein [Gammaproteobacteria bacterium]|nr:glycosyltransferase family 2 protein [Gammaproteobacteria bacterium]NIX84983.1 glycosyltransferase [Gammaproteobacteria bacterium]
MTTNCRSDSFKASVVIPAHNEEAGLQSIRAGLERLQRDGYEIVIVDDGSTDGTREIAREIADQYYRNPYQLGCGTSTKRGIEAAQSDLVVIMDADGEHRPEDVPAIRDNLGEFDLVIGRRAWRPEPLRKRIGRWLLTRLAERIAGRDIPDLTSGLRGFYRYEMRRFFHLLPSGQSFMTTSTLAYHAAGLSVGYVPVTFYPRLGGQSHVQPVRDALRAVGLMLRVSVLFGPMRVFMPVAVALGLIGSAYAGWGIATATHIPTGAVITLLAALLVACMAILADAFAAALRKE